MESPVSEGVGAGSYVPSCSIKRLNMVCMVSFDGAGMQQCAICKNGLMEASIEYQSNPSPSTISGLSVAQGSCGHGFHLDCIQRWCSKSRNSCPLCNREWDLCNTYKIHEHS